VSDEMNFDAVLLPVAARSDPQLADEASWHLVDSTGSLTWCGATIGYGARQMSWGETPNTHRCERCARQGIGPDVFD
jgi:hypothetical protein